MRFVLIMFVMVLASCAHLPPSPGANAMLVTIPIEGESTPPLSDSLRTYSNGEWDVPLKTRRLASAIVREHGLDVIDAWPLETVQEFCLVVNGGESAMDALRRDARVTSVQKIRHFVAMNSGYNDDRVSIQLGDHAEDLARLHEWSTGAGVRIGIIDSPVELAHPDLKRRIAREVLTIDRAPVDADKVHGTAVAGIIGAEANNHVGVVGFAPGAELFSYAACRYDDGLQQTRCNSFSMALAIEAAAKDDIDVLNLSLAGPGDPLLARMLRAIAERGTIIVAAEGQPQEDFPGNLPFVIAAGPLSVRGGNPDTIRVDDEHLSTTVGGRYRFFYGASMSAARVSALIGLMRQRAPGLDVAQSRLYLHNANVDCDGFAAPFCMIRFALENRTQASSGVMD